MFKLCVAVCLVLLATCANAETVYTFWPQEDAWVNQDNPTANYGSATYFSVKDRSSLAESFLKFSDSDLAQLSGAPLQSAPLTSQMAPQKGGGSGRGWRDVWALGQREGLISALPWRIIRTR